MSSLLRRLVVAFAFSGFGLWLAPASVSAATVTEPSVSTIEQCLKANLHGAQTISLGLAKRCAPTNSTILKGAHGYQIAVETSSSVSMPTPSDPCQWHTYNLLGNGYTDWLGVDFCWDGTNAWEDNVQQTCWTWLASAHCNYWYYNIQYGGYYVVVHAHYFHTCWFFFECDNWITMTGTEVGNYYVNAG